MVQVKSRISGTLSSRPAAIRSRVTGLGDRDRDASDADFGEEELDAPVAKARALQSRERAAAPRLGVSQPDPQRIRRIAAHGAAVIRAWRTQCGRVVRAWRRGQAGTPGPWAMTIHAWRSVQQE